MASLQRGLPRYMKVVRARRDGRGYRVTIEVRRWHRSYWWAWLRAAWKVVTK